LIKENESIKQELNEIKNDKQELEIIVQDLKHTLKLTEKESQVRITIIVIHWNIK
jgi:hypothetical protein